MSRRSWTIEVQAQTLGTCISGEAWIGITVPIQHPGDAETIQEALVLAGQRAQMLLAGAPGMADDCGDSAWMIVGVRVLGEPDDVRISRG